MAFFPGMREEDKQSILKAMKRPEGTLQFRARFNGIFDKSKGRGFLLDLVSGQTVFRLVREANLDIKFIYSSPGTGTRFSTVNIEPLKGSTSLQFFLTWSPEEVGLDIGGEIGGLLSCKGCKAADYQLLVGRDGSVHQIGSKGVQIRKPMVIEEGKIVLENSAIKNWEDTLEAVRILQSGTSPEGYIFESIVSCVSIVVLCTGFETYCKGRFLEIVGEGIDPNYVELEKKFFSKRERGKGLMALFAQKAKKEGLSLADELVERRRIDFGNYDNCKDAYSKGYGIRFTRDLGVTIQTIQKITAVIEYRHVIVHISPLIGALNYYELPDKRPVFPSKKLTKMAMKSFDDFIAALHKETLKLRPP